TLEWLRARASEAGRFRSAEEFARNIASELSEALNKRRFQNVTDTGIGIHFTAYERLDDYWIPELFHIRNWGDTSYSTVNDALTVTRETYGTSQNRAEREEADGGPDRRLAVYKTLREQKMMLIYNNGDPVLFTPIANAILGSFQQLMLRGQLR